MVDTSSGTKKEGNTKPIATPKGFAALAMVVAIAQPSSLYHAADTLAGAFRMNG